MDNEQPPTSGDTSRATSPADGVVPGVGPGSYPPCPPAAPWEQRPQRSRWRVLWGVFTGLSVLANVLLLLAVIGAVMTLAVGGGHGRDVQEAVVRSGTGPDKIAVVNLRGIIDSQLAERVAEHLRLAGEDPTVKGVILRIHSPGGGITPSDEIHDAVRTLRQDHGLPVVAFMQGLAASGGYYAAVACNKILAEPTTITGSIGVIMDHLVLEELLKEKLGIYPVVVKSGPRKDWPSSFAVPSEEQLTYLQNTLIQPAYERFLDVVAEGREETLSREEIRELADGSVYTAPEAARVHLIDEVGYLRDAIDLAESLAGTVDAPVVEYRRTFTIRDFLQARARPAFSFDAQTLIHGVTPELMYLWRVR